MSVAIERAVIATLMDGRHAKAWPLMAGAGIGPEFFTVPLHRFIVYAASEMGSRGQSIDTLAITTWLSQMPWQEARVALRDKITLPAYPEGMSPSDSVLAAVGGALAVMEINSAYGPIGGYEKNLEELVKLHRARIAYGILSKAKSDLEAVSGSRDLEATIAGAVNDLCRVLGNGTAERSLADCVDSLADEGFIKGLQPCGLWPIEALNEIAPMRPGELVVIAGYSGGGKTSLVLQTAWVTAKTRGRGSVAIASMEMRGEELAIKLVGSELGISRRSIEKGFLSPEQRLIIKEAARDWREHDVAIRDTTDQCKTDDILGWFRQRHQLSAGRLSVAVVDHLTLIDNGPKHKSEYERVTDATRRLKGFAMEKGICVIAISQFNRAKTGALKDREGRIAQMPEPTLEDLKGSGSIGQDANTVILLWPRSGNDVTIKIAKNRSGRTCDIEAEFDKAAGQVFRERPAEEALPQSRAHHKGMPSDKEDLFA